MLQVKNLCCMRGDRRLLENISFSLQAGQLMHLQGQNGSGKTTLIRAIAGLMPLEKGCVRWHGQDINRQPDSYHAALCYLGHVNGLKAELSAVENLCLQAVLHTEQLSHESAWRILQDMGLCGHEDIAVNHLSQGQKRRIALARLWFTRATLWLLDEPFSALDKTALEQLQNIIKTHLSNGGMVLLTSHQAVDLLHQDQKIFTLGRQHV